MTTNTLSSKSVWAPLGQPAFRTLWTASLIASLGGWTQDVAQAWLMTSLAPSPLMVALLQTATCLPFFLLALPAGALADVVDRRLLILGSQLWMFFAVIGLGLLTIYGATTSWLLLAMVLINSLGLATNAPAWNTLAPELVPRSQLESAIALTTAGLNVARGLGAALGGILVYQCGPGWVFLLNALSMVYFLIAVYRWQQEKLKTTAPSERLLGAMKAGVRYALHSVPLKAVLVRTAIFVASSSAIWALLPLMARQIYHLSAIEYGLLLSLFGFGTLVGAALVPRLRQNISQDQLALLGTFLCAICMAALSAANAFLLASAAMFTGGLGWITACAALNSSVLGATPTWVRARMIAIYLMIFQGCIAGGSLVWGVVANAVGMPSTLQLGAAGLVVGLIAMSKYSLNAAENVDVRSSSHWPEAPLALTPHPEHGPVLITIEYTIDPENEADFAAAISRLETLRRRDGAFRWDLFCDLSQPGRYMETFFVDTWGEFLRQKERATIDDRRIEEKVVSYHTGSQTPKISHLIAEKRRGQSPKFNTTASHPRPSPDLVNEQRQPESNAYEGGK
jgi:predicted MFS family arabinose efflux permease